MAIIKKKYGRKQQWRNEAIAYIVESLTELGQRACEEAISNKGYKNQLYNLRDSIGSAVYVNGHIQPATKRYAHRKSSKGTYTDRGENGTYDEITGREALDRYWDENPTIPNARNAVELVVIAATYYSGILEDRGIQVISDVVDFLEDEMDVYKSYKPKLRAHADMFDIEY